MTIESVSRTGARKFRISPTNHHMIQIQRGYRSRWQDYLVVGTLLEASALVLELARNDETQEMDTLRD